MAGRPANRAAAVLLGLCWLATASAEQYGFDFLMLVRQWGPGTCAGGTRCRHPPIAAYSIHGLWPQYHSGGWPEHCDPSSELDTSTFPRSLLSQMSCEWPSYVASNLAFWTYEWSKHGTCALPLMGSQLAYFNATISLNTRYDPNVALEEVVLPGRTVERSEVAAALRSAWGVDVAVSCANRDDLFELWMCVSIPDLQPMSCPPSVHTRACGQKLDVLPGDPVPAACAPYFPASSSRGAGHAGAPAPGARLAGGSAVPGAGGMGAAVDVGVDAGEALISGAAAAGDAVAAM